MTLDARPSNVVAKRGQTLWKKSIIIISIIQERQKHRRKCHRSVNIVAKQFLVVLCVNITPFQYTLPFRRKVKYYSCTISAKVFHSFKEIIDLVPSVNSLFNFTFYKKWFCLVSRINFSFYFFKELMCYENKFNFQFSFSKRFKVPITKFTRYTFQLLFSSKELIYLR